MIPYSSPVVDHLHEVPRPRQAAVEVSLFCGRGVRVRAARRARRVHARRDRREDRVEPLHDLVLSADHQAEPALEPEHAAARPTSAKCTPFSA